MSITRGNSPMFGKDAIILRLLFRPSLQGGNYLLTSRMTTVLTANLLGS